MTDRDKSLSGLTDHARRNRAFWNELSDTYQADHGPDLARHGAAWGVWQIPEDEVNALGDVAGKDVLELGCGAAQWSIALAQRGESGSRVIPLSEPDRPFGGVEQVHCFDAAGTGSARELRRLELDSD